jgi:PHD/YefM family antitoxin component YafN of YafNO toxin-antitoxin module
MASVNEGYIVDDDGNRVGVILPMEDYRRLMEDLEELESIRAYDAAKQSGDQAIPFEQAVREIEQDRS